MDNRKVNLFVVGAMRAGTTSFMDLLSKHEQIYVPPIKEPMYFIENVPKKLYSPSRFFSVDRYFEKEFPKKKHIAQIIKESHYDKLFSLAENQKYLVDGSTFYLHAPESPKLIHKYNPKAKIIIITRDPLERAFSHFRMNVGLGREKRSFELAIKDEIDQYINNSLPWSSYLNMSKYYKSIHRYKSLFNDVLVIELENLITNLHYELQRLPIFLDLGEINNPLFERHNRSENIRFKKLFFVLNNIGFKDYFSKYFPKKYKDGIIDFISNTENNIEFSLPLREEFDRAINDRLMSQSNK